MSHKLKTEKKKTTNNLLKTLDENMLTATNQQREYNINKKEDLYELYFYSMWALTSTDRVCLCE